MYLFLTLIGALFFAYICAGAIVYLCLILRNAHLRNFSNPFTMFFYVILFWAYIL